MAIDYPTDSPSYLPRYIDLELDELKGASAIAIDGPKAVGKSETATRRANRTYFLDRDSERELLRADMDALLVAEDTLCIDEWQHLPQVWDAVRRNVDKQVTTRYLLTGSATPKQGVDTHSGAGRVISLRMRPLALSERADTSPTVKIAELFTGTATISGHTDYSLTDYAEALSATGLPGVCRQPARLRRQLIDAYVQRVIDRDVPEQGLLVRKPESLRAWWAAYAAASSTTTSYTKILNAASPGDAAKISKDSALGYRDILSKLWLLDPVPAWFPTPSPFKSSLPPRSIRYLIPALRPLCSVLRRTYLPPASPARGSCLASSSNRWSLSLFARLDRLPRRRSHICAHKAEHRRST